MSSYLRTSVCRRLRSLLYPQASMTQVRSMCDKNDRSDRSDKSDSEKRVPVSLQQKFVPFEDSDSAVIRDWHEQQYGMQWEVKHREVDEESFYLYRERKKPDQRAYDSPVTRGVHGVFDIQDLVLVLRSEKLVDISVVRVPEHAHYCDYLVLATTKSRKHMEAVMQMIRKLYKLKKHDSDPFLGEAIGQKYSSNWQIFDMGYIVLHLFQREVRPVYDLESLWCVGPQFDENTVRPKYDAVVDFMDKQIKFMEQLQPLSENEQISPRS